MVKAVSSSEVRFPDDVFSCTTRPLLQEKSDKVQEAITALRRFLTSEAPNF